QNVNYKNMRLRPEDTSEYYIQLANQCADAVLMDQLKIASIKNYQD
ncbi:21351_t:CDS:1, partial [Racocetra persica]